MSHNTDEIYCFQAKVAKNAASKHQLCKQKYKKYK